MKRSAAFALTLAVLLAVGGPTNAAEKAAVWPAGDLKWVDNPALKGAKQAVLWGDPAKGPYGTIKKVPAGAKLGLHTHTADQRVVVVSGTVAFNVAGEPVKDLGAGSFISMPGGVAHDATCKAGADCVYFEEGMGAADFKPVTKK